MWWRIFYYYPAHFLVRIYFLQTFLSNESEAQLLFTIHDQLILTEDFMRRDMAWFTEKRRKPHQRNYSQPMISTCTKTHLFFNAYKLGKLGARPQVGSPFLAINPSKR